MLWLRQHRHLVLLSALGLGLVMQSIPRGVLGGLVFSRIILALMSLLVLLIVFEHHRSRITAVFVAIALVLSSVAHVALSGKPLEIPLGVLHYALLTAFFAYAVAVILGNIFRKSAVDTDDVLGAVSGYLIAAAAWSSLYALTYTLVPDAFTLAPAFVGQLSGWPERTAVFNYFSIVTMTTMGYGDITPVRAPATTFVLMEAIFGQFYIAIVVAQLVGARLSSRVDQKADDL